MTKGLKIGCIEYLNAEPLVWPLENNIIENNLSFVRDVPSKLIEMLESEDIDCALAPVVTLLDHPDYIKVPEVSISCRGPVASVLMFHNGPFEKTDKIYLDPSSRTSNLLLRILRDTASEVDCEFIMPDGTEPPALENLSHGTGRLVIGDPALRAIGPGHRIMPPILWTDLGELWRSRTGHPFTFARWIARTGTVAGELIPLFTEARDWSLLHLHEIVPPLAEKYGFPTDLVDRYLRNNIVYMHGPREQAGEREFFIKAGKYLRDREKNSDA